MNVTHIYSAFLAAGLCARVAAQPQSTPPEITSNALPVLESLSSAVPRADWGATDTELSRLVAFGPQVIPLLVEKVKTNDGTPGYRQYLVRAIANIGKGGEASTKALLDLTLSGSDVAGVAGGWLSNRRIDFPLNHQQVTNLAARINEDNFKVAAGWAYVLARATNVDQRLIIEPVVKRFMRAVRERKAPFPPYELGYLNEEVTFILQHLRPFRHIATGVAVPVLRKEIAQTQDKWMLLWLTIALGYSGDSTVAGSLLEVLESPTEQSSIRAEALSAYALALGQGAIPVLERYVSDKTPGPDPRSPPLDVVARSELAKFRRNPAGERPSN